MTPRELAPRYDPSALEARWYAAWRAQGLFHPPSGEGPPPPYTIVIPPPNVTGVLHMGHALNNTVQDVFIRHARMQGRRALYLPGTDHAGIATQNVVERQLAAEGKTRGDLGRAAFVERVWEWKRRYGHEIDDQLMQLGISCDWERARFTMDAGLSRAVREVFVRLFEEGLIYRGHYIINWCPRCGTALSDEEAEKREQPGFLYRVRYPLAEGPGFIEIATTRPETILGDTGIAVHPDDPRYAALIGRRAVLPLVGRELPIVADDVVDPAFGTGAVKVTPAHDPNDFWIGARHDLATMNILNPDATLNASAGRFAGLDRYAARREVVAALEAEGALVASEPHSHAVGHCYRCDTVIEPYLSDQWFVRMRPLAEPALAALRDGTLRLTPERWGKVYAQWLENVRDWCISRQIWWGHRIPVWTCGNGHVFAAREDPAACPACSDGVLEQDPDVLDTWFSSWLWPFSTFGWPDDTPDLRTFYPTQTLVTGSEILFFWVARMVMAGYYSTGACPFDDVVINGTVRDEQGRRMSKSLGNGIDPRDVIAEHGADALRYTLAAAAPIGTDLRLAPADFLHGRNVANKLWNAARFIFLNVPADFAPLPLAPEGIAGAATGPVDRWMLHRLDVAGRAVDAALASFRPDEAATAVYDVFWHDLCDWYIEWAKAHLDGPRGDVLRSVLLEALGRIVRLWHPVMPFITEELWQHLPEALRPSDSILVAPWPAAAGWDYPADAELMTTMQLIISEVRNLRAGYGVPPSRRAPLIITAADPAMQAALAPHAADIARLAGASASRIEASAPAAGGYVTQVVRGGVEVAVRLADLVDLERERARLAGEAERVSALLGGTLVRLSDDRFMARAPADVVARERAKAERFERDLERLTRLRAGLEAGAS
ncbi:MAG: valine--tRNA ligase [Gemmatimonadota bacterium]